MEEMLGEMRKGRRERMRKGAIVSSSPQGMTSWSSSIKIWFFQASRMHNWESEASPTLGCSIEISRDIYMYICIYVCRYVSYVKLTA